MIGTDGTRWDLLDAAMKAGRAPNLARLRREGFGHPTLLEFGPNTFTLSEVGWSSIASGVWEDKHGIDGSKFNMDPGQATKNGYLDFLTRIENRRPRPGTFLASDWDNLGLAENGGRSSARRWTPTSRPACLPRRSRTGTGATSR